jgi:D-glycero-D-manno-heptose 1,7-bisphosphate phosphatase
MGKKAVFLDRDGVVNVEKDYAHKIEDFEFLSGVFEAVRAFNRGGYIVVVVTNQSGIGRGYYTSADFEKLTEYMLDRFKEEGCEIAGVYHCPHTPDSDCECRKPNPGMLLAAQKELDIDLSASWMIGDKESDIEAALAAGVQKTVLVRSGHKIDEKNTKATFVVNGIFDTIRIVTDFAH